MTTDLSMPGSDLPKLNAREAALDGFLGALFAANDIVKAGFAFQGDLRNLCRSFPHMHSFGQGSVSVSADSSTTVGPAYIAVSLERVGPAKKHLTF